MLRLAAMLLLAMAATVTGAADLDVMSFNIRYGLADDGEDSWPMRRDQVVETIIAAGPDLLGTQECLDFQRDHLADALPGYTVIGVGRDDGAEAGEMCACFYRTDRFTLLDQGTFWLSETPDVVASRGWDAALHRIATWLRLQDTENDTELLWLNTHFDHVGEEARLESLSLIHDWLTANGGDAALVVTGDFNLDAASGEGAHQSRLLGDILADTWTAMHGDEEPTVGTFNGFGKRPRPGRIDWILASPDLNVKRASVVRTQYGERWPSDHCPVTAGIGFD